MVDKCEYGVATRDMLLSLDRRIDSGFTMLNGKVDSFHMELAEMDKRVTNHLAHRLPVWVAAVFTVAGGIIGALLTIVIALLQFV